MRSLDECYALLNLAPTRDQALIKAAFRRQALLWHPDVVQGAEGAEAASRFLLLRNAYETLLLVGDALPNVAKANQPVPKSESPASSFSRQLNSLLWDLEDVFRDARSTRNRSYFGPMVQRDLLKVLIRLDKDLLVDRGLGDHFMTARQRPALDPESYLSILPTGSKIALHFPYTSVENYFFALRLRMNRFLDLVGRGSTEPRQLEGYLDTYRGVVFALTKIQRGLAQDLVPTEEVGLEHHGR